MRRKIGIALIASSLIIAAFLILTGTMEDEKPAVETSGQWFGIGWSVAIAETPTSGFLAIPLLIAFVVGFICLVMATKESG